jgi:hypothetical protein
MRAGTGCAGVISGAFVMGIGSGWWGGMEDAGTVMAGIGCWEGTRGSC